VTNNTEMMFVSFSRKLKKYKSLPPRDSAAVYTELIDNHVNAPQPCKLSPLY